MYIGFELKKINANFFDNFDHYLNIGEITLKKHRRAIKDTLDEFENYNGSLNGDKMQSNWFPQINADIFLSHSHADEDLVIAFVGWLKNNFNLDAFIDSCIWGYHKNLQKIIDNKYCLNKNGKLIYDKVIDSSIHVHMMLNTALIQMIDNCECTMFINTPNSVKPNEVSSKIFSPWIYSEVGMTKLIKKKSISEHRTQKLNESIKIFSELTIEYNLDTDHLIQLTTKDLRDWIKKYHEKNQMLSLNNYIEKQRNNFNKTRIKNALDCLYKLKE